MAQLEYSVSDLNSVIRVAKGQGLLVDTFNGGDTIMFATQHGSVRSIRITDLMQSLQFGEITLEDLIAELRDSDDYLSKGTVNEVSSEEIRSQIDNPTLRNNLNLNGYGIIGQLNENSILTIDGGLIE